MIFKKKKINQFYDDVVNKLETYHLISCFSSKEKIEKWILSLSDVALNNFLSLNENPADVKFDYKILIDNNLLNKNDYIERVNAFLSINNADGYHHLFNSMLNPDFLDSERFYDDIEMLKKAECAQTPLWIIGDSNFINSPYHDEDFKLLVEAKDKDENNDHVLWDAIATVAANKDSINSPYHRQDLKTIIKYSSKSLQLSHSYPERCINYLAINPVSLKDKYHLENMEILVNNVQIGNFLYAVMTDKIAINKNDYRKIIDEMVNNKENIRYVFLLCYYAVGEEKSYLAQGMHNYLYEIEKYYDMKYLTDLVYEKLNVIDSEEVNKKELSLKNIFDI